tara:strand:+ start:82 stop:228 length:147 start_codon:yes stop_codon:yes gene_type:complete
MGLFEKKPRPYWEVMSDDSMNKVLKFVVFCIFAYGAYVVGIELINRFF